MLPGPVFNVELVTTARRARYYAIRFGYGMLLLFFVVQTVGVWPANAGALWEGGTLSIAEMALTGQRIFATFTVFQGVAVLVLTPALVAGVVADEKRRKTLQYLMASRLSSAEIVLGKLLARSLHVGIFLAIGVPVMSLISLFGGVEPGGVMLAYLGDAHDGRIPGGAVDPGLDLRAAAARRRRAGVHPGASLAFRTGPGRGAGPLPGWTMDQRI
jgi:hypothetical protein